MRTTDFENEAIVKKYRKYLFVNEHFGKPAFVKFIGKTIGLNVLDLGCGTGHLCRMEFKNTHWTLEFLFKVLKENGFTISEMKEPMPKKGRFWGYFKNILQVPHYIFIKAAKTERTKSATYL
ncbi:MAG: hypothetical protein QMD85_03900 [Candidatus Aenigmarchaeota archaeon]|nr:hypothetical protein [Candidatus Aenigmarchaeota archaeon]